MSEVIIDGVNVAECEFLDDKYCNLSNERNERLPFPEICSEYEDCLYKQLQRVKAKLEQYKKSKQASYEAMQEQWNYAINTLRDVEAENERLKEELRNNETAYQIELATYNMECGNLLNENKDLYDSNDKLQSLYQNEHCDNLKYKQALEKIRTELLQNSCANSEEIRNVIAIIDGVYR